MPAARVRLSFSMQLITYAPLLRTSSQRAHLCGCIRSLTVPARRLAAAGPVVSMSVLSMPPQHYLLVVHEGSGAAVWDLRAQIMVAVAGHGSGSGGGRGNGGDDGPAAAASSTSSKLAAITAAAWLPGSSKGDFATGHQDGAVCIWDMPASAGNSTSSTTSNGPIKQQQTLQAQLVSQLQGGSSASSGGSPKRHRHSSSRAGPRLRPVASLEFAAGAVECLVVFGGNEEDRPDGLTLLPLPEPAPVCAEAPCTRLLHTGAGICQDAEPCSDRACARLLTPYPMRAVLTAVVCVLPPQAPGIEDADATQQHQQAATAAAVQLPWLGPILQTALVPMQVRLPSISQLGGRQTSFLCWQEDETGRLFFCLLVCWIQGCSVSSNASMQELCFTV